MNPNNFKPVKTLRLNDSGSRWIEVDANMKKEKLAVYFPENKEVKYITIAFIEQCGNFCNAFIKIKGKTYPTISRYSVNSTDALGYKEVMVNNDENRKIKYQKITLNYPAQTV
jgi:hypothetical protein